MSDLDQEILISVLRHENLCKDIAIQRLMYNMVEKEDLIIALQERIKKFLEDAAD